MQPVTFVIGYISHEYLWKTDTTPALSCHRRLLYNVCATETLHLAMNRPHTQHQSRLYADEVRISYGIQVSETIKPIFTIKTQENTVTLREPGTRFLLKLRGLKRRGWFADHNVVELYRPSTAGGRRSASLRPSRSSRFLAGGSNDVVEQRQRNSTDEHEWRRKTGGRPAIDRRLLTLFTASASATAAAAAPRNPCRRHHVGWLRALQSAHHCDEAGPRQQPHCRGTRWQLLVSRHFGSWLWNRS